jgi:plasmid stabilization system protein ParE
MAEISFHSGAKEGYANAYAWYFERNTTAAGDFETAVDKALEEIADAPARWHPVDPRHRTHVLKRFPYQIIYRVDGEFVIVIAIAHARRRPGFWKDRN